MIEHIIFLLYLIFFLTSIAGYGLILSKLINNKLLKLNIGYQGLFGFFFISFISLISSYFFKHGFAHNTILHLIGVCVFFYYVLDNERLIYEYKNLLIIFIICLISIYVFKNHDDFPYYHLTYSLNLSENKFIIGTGVFSHGFRTFSSIFYFHSTLYMPLIKFYLFHSGPFFILIFFNYIIIQDIIESNKTRKFGYTYFFSLLSLAFVNIVFYRIGEHGTDRSAQILILLIFKFYYDLFYFPDKNKDLNTKILSLLIIIFLAASMKIIYYVYLIFVPIILIKRKHFQNFFNKLNNYKLIFILTIFFTSNILTNFLSTGCLVYPAIKTCVGSYAWSIPDKEVKRMRIHYEWWAKAGGGPGYVSEIPKEKYIINFVWFKNWVERHFFNKVSDTLFLSIFFSIIFFIFFKFTSMKEKKKNNLLNISMFLFPSIFLIEWFLNHPSMRYGGFVLVILPLIVLTSSLLNCYNYDRLKIAKYSIIFIIFIFIIFTARNVQRINKEIKIYNYNILKSPFFYVKDVSSITSLKNDDFVIYSPQQGMCWGSSTPCSYNRKLKHKKIMGFDMVYRNDW